MRLALNAFQGIAPRIAEHLLPDGAAVLAENCRLMRGSLGAWYDPAALYTPSPQSTWPPYQSIFRYQSAAQRAAGTAYWLTWADEIQATMTPIPNDEHDRCYFTGDGAPKVTSSDLVASGSGAYPHASKYIGVPAPTTAPTVSKSGTATTDDVTTLVSRSFCYTFVNEYGEESAPSPVAAEVAIYPGMSWSISGLETTYSSNYRAMDEKRIYATNTGSSGTEYQLVATVTPATTSTTLAYAFTDFGSVLDTQGWYPPPDDMIGLVALPWGSLAGFAPNNPLGGSGNAVYLSSPYQAHAWLTEYAFAVVEQIVALAAFGNSLLVLTDGLPTVTTGVSPSALSYERLKQGYSCTSRLGVVNVAGNVIYPCPQGLASVGVSGSKLLTEAILTEREWASLYPYTIRAYAYAGHYVGFYDSSYDAASGYTDPRDASATRGAFICNLATGQFTTLSGLEATAGHAYLGGDALALHTYSDSKLVSFDGDTSSPMTYAWRSKPTLYGFRVGMTVAQVYAASYPVTVQIYVDGTLKHTESVADEDPFRLPPNLKGRRWQVRLDGTKEVYQVLLASAVEELGEG